MDDLYDVVWGTNVFDVDGYMFVNVYDVDEYIYLW